MSTDSANPAALVSHDPAWESAAADVLRDVREVLSDLRGAAEASDDHIGSTAVPGLAAAKPYLDLQVRILPLPSHEQLTTRLGGLGFDRARGARPDSPASRTTSRAETSGSRHRCGRSACTSGAVMGSGSTSVAVTHHGAGTQSGSATGYVLTPRLASPTSRRKRELSAGNEGKADYDDYTRAKTKFFDEVQQHFTRRAVNSSRDRHEEETGAKFFLIHSRKWSILRSVPTTSDFERMLRGAALRVTRPRVAVLAAVHAHPHADTDSIIGAVRRTSRPRCPTRPCTTCCAR